MTTQTASVSIRLPDGEGNPELVRLASPPTWSRPDRLLTSRLDVLLPPRNSAFDTLRIGPEIDRLIFGQLEPEGAMVVRGSSHNI